jgi:imidazolonepropionase-like amidohydrolase
VKRASVFVLLLFFGAALAGAARPVSTVVIRCGRLIDGRADRPAENASIVVQDGKIIAIGENATVPSGAQIVDLGRATVLPGLMDLHVHLMIGNFLNESSAHKALSGMRNAQTMLRCGFTTIRIPGDGDTFYSPIEIRNAIARGEYVGPRMLVAPHNLTATGGHGDINDLAPDMAVLSVGKIISGPESVRQRVREEIKYGADWIKLYVTGGVMSANDNPRVQSMTDEEIRAAVDEAHRYLKKVCVHAIGTEGIKSAVRAGVDSVEHGILIDQEGINLMRERGTYLVPTLYVLNYVVEQGVKAGFPAGSIAKGKSIIAERDRNIRAAFAAGVKIAFGSDTIFPHDQANREFALMVGLGLTPMQAIKAATINSADLLGLEKEIGSLEVGKRADIIAVGDSPLDDIRALERVKFVMKDGQVIRNDFQAP